MAENKNSSNGQSDVSEQVLDDIWGEEGMFHLRILKDDEARDQGRARVIEICNCGMSGKCKPLGRITIADFRRKRVVAAFDRAEQSNDSRP